VSLPRPQLGNELQQQSAAAAAETQEMLSASHHVARDGCSRIRPARFPIHRQPPPIRLDALVQGAFGKADDRSAFRSAG